MAPKKKAVGTVHMLDRTVGIEDDSKELMCGKTTDDLGPDDLAVDPRDKDMPPTCQKADKEGRMCLVCKRVTTAYAKGIYVGEQQERIKFLASMARAVEKIGGQLEVVDREGNTLTESKHSH